MTTTTIRPPEPPGSPLPVVVEVGRAGAALRCVADHAHGLVRVELAAEPRAAVVLAPEAALELSLHLVSRVNDLRHGGRARP